MTKSSDEEISLEDHKRIVKGKVGESIDKLQQVQDWLREEATYGRRVLLVERLTERAKDSVDNQDLEKKLDNALDSIGELQDSKLIHSQDLYESIIDLKRVQSALARKKAVNIFKGGS